MRTVPLTVIKGGLSRLRVRGGARADNLYTLDNGQVTEEGTVTIRPGTTRHDTVSTTTKGLVSFDGLFHVFAHQATEVPEGYTCHILASPAATPSPVKKIHFAKPLMGYLYVVAEFDDGNIRHFWLYEGRVWQPDAIYMIGDVVAPTTPNGLMFRGNRLSEPNPPWRAATTRLEGDVVEPTVYNGFAYTVDDIAGPGISGVREPDWIAQDETITQEESDVGQNALEPAASSETPNPSSVLPRDLLTRYGKERL